MKTILLLALMSVQLVFAQDTVAGYVYEDTNRNDKKESRENGIANVMVSNGIEVVATDKNGRYVLPVYDDHQIFVIKPSGYQTKMTAQNIPQFYYHHKPKGSPAKSKYKGVEPTGKLPSKLNFPLYKTSEEEDFQMLAFGDPQPYNLQEVDYFKRGIVDEVKNNSRKALFGMSLGDLVGNDLSLFNPYQQAVKEIGLPWYNVMGNHDMNFDASRDEDSDETFEAHFGPANYAFNYGKVHFIILDDILYPDPRDGKSYWGGFRKDQLKFVENDLKLVPKDHLVVVAFHIQLKSQDAADDHYRDEDRDQLLRLLFPFENVLLLSAHTHKQSQFYHEIEVGGQKKIIHEINMGTTSGDWYSGEPDEVGVPASVMRDGTYRGYSFINFSKNQYKVEYKSAGKPSDFAMTVHLSKVIPFESKNSAKIMVNFFVGNSKDEVKYRIDNGPWKNMNFAPNVDYEYAISVLKWDTEEQLLQGRRPSNPEKSTHIWEAGFPKKLSLGEHQLEVRATDQYGKTYRAEKHFVVSEPHEIP